MSDSPSIWSGLRRLLLGKKTPPLGSPPAILPSAEAPQTQSPQAPPTLSSQPAPNLTSRVTTVTAPAVDLVMGIDLGTSCSKVVIGDPGWKNKSFAVSFGKENGNISTWLRPTRFGSEANLKMRLMNDPSCNRIRDLLACYLAEVITRSRTWFEKNCPNDYSRREIRWSLNLGFPGKAVDATPLAQAYRNIAGVAVALASHPEAPSLELAARIRTQGVECESFIPPARIQLYPEIAAQLAGYVNSPHKKTGNLLLIDVGAGTLDVSTIILHGNQEQDIVSFHCCEVEELGVLRLYERRKNALENIVNGCVRYPLEHFQDGSKPAPERLSDLTQHPSRALHPAFARVSLEFSEEIVNVALSCLVRFRKSQRQVNVSQAADPWGKNLRFFLTGGGGRSPFYTDQLAGGPLEDKLAPNYTRWNPDRARRQSIGEGLLLERLPAPRNLQNFPKELRPHFDRLSVAYGLAYGGENLMKITSTTSQ